MKIHKEHLETMKVAIAPLAPLLQAHLEAIKAEGKSKDIAKRLRWDAARAAKLTPFFCETVYSYANDEHIDTALRSVMSEFFPAAA